MSEYKVRNQLPKNKSKKLVKKEKDETSNWADMILGRINDKSNYFKSVKFLFLLVTNKTISRNEITKCSLSITWTLTDHLILIHINS